MPQIKIDGFDVTISHHGGIVTAESSGSRETFEQRLMICDKVLDAFNSSQTNRWGSNGIGWFVQEKTGHAIRHLSTVGPRQFQQGMDKLLSI